MVRCILRINKGHMIFTKERFAIKGKIGDKLN